MAEPLQAMFGSLLHPKYDGVRRHALEKLLLGAQPGVPFHWDQQALEAFGKRCFVELVGCNEGCAVDRWCQSKAFAS